MQRLFDNAELMSLTHNFEYIGDFNFRNTQNINLRGVVLLPNSSGIKDAWEAISGLTFEANDYSDIYVNGTYLGKGTLNSLNFEAGADILNKRYNASLTLYSTGDLSNFTGVEFSGLSNLSSQRTDLLESLSEDFSFSQEDDGTFNYERSLTLKIISGDGTNPTNIAKSIAQIMFSGYAIPVINAAYPSFYNTSGNKYYSESYDLAKGDYSFSESFRFQDNDDYIWTYSHSAEFSDNFSNVTENGVFVGVGTNPYDTARDAYISNIASAFSRCNQVYSVYMGTGCSGLINSPNSQSITNNIYNGEVEYSITFSDDFTNITGCVWENTLSFEKDRDGVYIFREDGSVRGRGAKTYNPNNQYLAALSCFSGISGQVYNRVSVMAQQQLSGTPCVSGISLMGKNFTDSEYEGIIDYSFEYTNSKNYQTPSGILYHRSGYSIDDTVPLTSVYGILNDKQYIAPVFQGNSSLGVLTNNIEVVSDGGPLGLINAMAHALTLIKTADTESFINELTYDFEPISSRLNLNVSYNFVKYREFSNILV